MGPSELRTHLERRLLPLWDARGWDATHGGFHSRLQLDLSPVPDGFKRLTVQMRQLYVYSLAALADATADWLAARADATYEHVCRRFWDSKHAGWYLTTTSAGEPLDRSKDLYAQSFALLALVTYHQLRPGAGALARALETLGLLQRHLGDPRHGGFLEAADEAWIPQPRPRRHDPHMHLLEALLTGHAATTSEPFAEVACQLVELFVERLYPASRGGLPELYGDDWTPLPQTHVEPGHHFEWCWLLDVADQLGVECGPRELRWELYDFAARHGVDRGDGAVFDRLALDGTPLDRRKRVWPQCEYQKALGLRLLDRLEPTQADDPEPVVSGAPSGAAGLPTLGPASILAGASSPAARPRSGALDPSEALDPLPALERSLRLSFDRYVDPRHGGWNEHASQSGRIESDVMNATTVYHVYVAFSEVARCLESVRDRSPADGGS